MSPTLDQLWVVAVEEERRSIAKRIDTLRSDIRWEYEDHGPDKRNRCRECGEPCEHCGSGGSIEDWAKSPDATQKAAEAIAEIAQLQADQKANNVRRKMFRVTAEATTP